MEEDPGLDNYQIIIGLFVIVAFASILFWLTFFKSVGDEKSNIEGWQSNTMNGISFEYPDRLTTRYASPVAWPPQIELLSGPIDCRDGKCVSTVSTPVEDGTLTQHSYRFEKNGQIYSLTFSIKYADCEKLVGGAIEECVGERNIFDVNKLVKQISNTIKVKD